MPIIAGINLCISADSLESMSTPECVPVTHGQRLVRISARVYSLRLNKILT